MNLKKIMGNFKQENGVYQIKPFIECERPYPLGGCATFVSFHEKCFIVTCFHCISYLDETDYEKIIFPVKYGEKLRSPKIRDVKINKEVDLAAFEISCNSLNGTNKSVIPEVSFDDVFIKHFTPKDLIFIHGTPFERVNQLNFEDEGAIPEYDLETFPSMVSMYEHDDGLVYVAINKQGLGEDGQIHEIPELNGMSGCPAFRYDLQGDTFKFIGIMSNASKESEKGVIIDIEEIKSLLL